MIVLHIFTIIWVESHKNLITQGTSATSFSNHAGFCRIWMLLGSSRYEKGEELLPAHMAKGDQGPGDQKVSIWGKSKGSFCGDNMACIVKVNGHAVMVTCDNGIQGRFPTILAVQEQSLGISAFGFFCWIRIGSWMLTTPPWMCWGIQRHLWTFQGHPAWSSVKVPKVSQIQTAGIQMT